MIEPGQRKKTFTVGFHSQNPVGSKRMKEAIKNSGLGEYHAF